jgi:hypothetical protein
MPDGLHKADPPASIEHGTINYMVRAALRFTDYLSNALPYLADQLRAVSN